MNSTFEITCCSCVWFMTSHENDCWREHRRYYTTRPWNMHMVLLCFVLIWLSSIFSEVTGQNVDKPKRRQPKRRQTKTSTNRNVDRPKRRQTKTSTNRNVDKPKRRQTKTSTDRNVDKPKRRQTETSPNQFITLCAHNVCICTHNYIILGVYSLYQTHMIYSRMLCYR